MKIFLSSILAGALLSTAAVAAPALQEARIPFADHGAIRNWQADGDSALYLQGDGSQWYHATTMGVCRDLAFAETIGFQAGGIGDFDRFSTLIVRGQRCPVASVVKSGPPPKKAHKNKS
ncbi:MAG: hypothetical protein JWR77_2441 [Rhizorhabdus sp.]|nr:hypothetical protein [Rhizorhabdus sp.]